MVQITDFQLPIIHATTARVSGLPLLRPSPICSEREGEQKGERKTGSEACSHSEFGHSWSKQLKKNPLEISALLSYVKTALTITLYSYMEFTERYNLLLYLSLFMKQSQ